MRDDLHKFFYPKSVAVVGVSEREDNLARNIVSNLLRWEYKGDIYLVNPKGGRTFDREIHKSLLDIQEDIDLVAVLSPAATLPQIMEDCGKKGVKNVTISTGGFGELSEEGDKLIKDTHSIARKYNIRFTGPNGIATINTEIGLCLPFARLEKMEKGDVSILAQSGGIGLSIMILLRNEGLSLNKFVSLGNKNDLDEVDFLEYLKDDPETKVIVCYLESIERGKKLIEVAKKIKKPIILYKANRGSEIAQKAAKSHTAALAVDDKIVDTMCEISGIIRVNQVHKTAKLAKMFIQSPRIKGKNIIPMSLAGGWSVISADCAAEYGFNLPPLADESVKILSEYSRAGVIKFTNPMDLGDAFSPMAVFRAIELALSQEDNHAVIMAFFIGRLSVQSKILEYMKHFNVALEELIKKYQKPFVFCLLSDPQTYETMRSASSFPVFYNAEEAFEILAKYRDWCIKEVEVEKEEEINVVVKKDKVEKMLKKQYLSDVDKFSILNYYGIKTPKVYLIKDEKELENACEKIGYPIVMKISSCDIFHKTDIGGVRVGISSKKDAKKSFKEIIASAKSKYKDARIDGVLLYKMLPQGEEVILGMKEDRSFGKIIMFGLGGIFVEILKDVSFGVLPITRGYAEKMIKKIKGYPLLEGTRGGSKKDINSIIDVILKLSQLSLDFPQIKELDINPLFVWEKGCCAVDVKMVIDTIFCNESAKNVQMSPHFCK